MRRKILLLLSLLFYIAAESQAEEACSQKEFYGKIFAGANFLQKTTLNENRSKYDAGYLLAGSLGYYWCNGLHVEAEYAYRRNAIKKIDLFGQGSATSGHLRTSSYMANLLWDLPLSLWKSPSWDIQPIIGAGIGYDRQKMGASNSRIDFHQKWNRFSWQLMAGVICPLFCNTDMTLEYKFHQGSSHFCNHSIGVGFIYKFGFL